MPEELTGDLRQEVTHAELEAERIEQLLLVQLVDAARQVWNPTKPRRNSRRQISPGISPEWDFPEHRGRRGFGVNFGKRVPG